MVEVVQEHLGRTSVQVTLDTHSHIWPEDEDRTLISENSCPAPRSLGDDSSGRIVTPPQDLFFLRCAGRFERLCLPSASIDRIRGEGGANGSTLLGGRSSPRPLHRLHWPDTYRAGPDPTRPDHHASGSRAPEGCIAECRHRAGQIRRSMGPANECLLAAGHKPVRPTRTAHLWARGSTTRVTKRRTSGRSSGTSQIRSCS
jgi:hypothetical protein